MLLGAAQVGFAATWPGTVGSPRTFGRSTEPSTLALSLLTRTVNGRPLCSERMPEISQPPASALAIRFVLRNGLPFPNGSWYTGLRTMRWRISKPERPRSRGKFVGSMALERDGVTLKGVPGESSIDFPYMYARRKERRL